MAFYHSLLLLCAFLGHVNCDYDPTWDSLDTRPLPEWFDKAKIGIFVQWGVYSVPSFRNEWFWLNWKEEEEDYVNFMKNNYPPNFTYQDFAKEFTAEFYDPIKWVNLFVKSGAKYVILTSKHGEGYTLWPSKYSYNWNVDDVGPNRNLLGDLADAVRKTDLHFGLFYCLWEYSHPFYNDDQANNCTTSTFVDSKVIPEMKELINTFRPEILWAYDDREKSPDTYWKSTEFLAWLYNESPVKDVVVTNDRWGSGTYLKHGSFFWYGNDPDPVPLHKWTRSLLIDKVAWGYRREADLTDLATTIDLITTIVKTISRGGNVVIVVGPTKEGTITPIFQERLLDVGSWLSINGEAIYESSPWTVYNDTLTSGVWYTTKNSSVYAMVLQWPEDNLLTLGSVNSLFTTPDTRITLLGEDNKLLWKISGAQVNIFFPVESTVSSKWAWVLKISPQI